MIALAMQTIEASTCLRFLPKDRDKVYFVTIKKDEPKCWANVGQLTNGKLNLDTGCWVKYELDEGRLKLQHFSSSF